MSDVMEEYQSSLEDLTFNSKPHINMLTILAEENKSHAESIVHLIEAQIAKATEKLPLLYLLDSIIKNVGENYKPLFAKNLKTVFKQSFQRADDKSKMSLYKLRSTWDNYFPLKSLHALDVTIKELDPNWPVKSLPSHLHDNTATTIHVNPKFIKKNDLGHKSVPTVAAKSNTVKSFASNSQSSDVDKIRQQFMRQQKELIDLQQKKLILELEQTKQELAAKQREAQHGAIKIQKKTQKDPRKPAQFSSPGLRVTLSNDKASVPTSTSSPSIPPQDPRLKAAAIPGKKDLAAKVGASKPTAVISTTKKKGVQTAIKEKSVSPKVSPAKSKLLKQDKSKSNDSLNKKLKESTLLAQKMNSSVLETAEKKQKRSNPSKSPVSPSPTPPKVPRITSSMRRSPDGRKKSKEQRVQKLKSQHMKGSSRSSESSMSPRFSPEPEVEDLQTMDIPPPPMPFDKGGDALRRRPSFDPDLHIPKELTLSHQHEILKQADHQLRTGQLTHRQHQELLKQLHQLFEVQRMKKMQDAGDRHPDPNRLPIDPRQMRRNRDLKHSAHRNRSPQFSQNEMPDHQMKRSASKGRGPMAPPQFNENSSFSSKPASMQRRMSPDRRVRQESHNQMRRPPAKGVRVAEGRPMQRPPPPPDLFVPKKLQKPMSKYEQQHGSRPPVRKERRPSYPLKSGSSEKSPHLMRGPELARKHPAQEDPRSIPSSQSFNSPNQLQAPVNYNSPNNSNLEGQAPHLGPSQPHVFESDDIEPPPRPPLSPPPFFLQHNNSKPSAIENTLNNKSFSSDELEKHRSLRQYASSEPVGSKAFERRSSDHQQSPSYSVAEKAGPEEPEEYIIANMSKEAENQQLEEPEDYIIAGMRNDADDRKKSCEEPEDFIISQIPPEAEAYHHHSVSLKRNSDSEKAYMDHMRKIKQSMYTKESQAMQKASSSGTASSAEESASEKPPKPSAPKKEETKSPVLPPKKRRYVSSENETTKDERKKETLDKPVVVDKPSSKVKVEKVEAPPKIEEKPEPKSEVKKEEKSKVDDEKPKPAASGGKPSEKKKETVVEKPMKPWDNKHKKSEIQKKTDSKRKKSSSSRSEVPKKPKKPDSKSVENKDPAPSQKVLEKRPRKEEREEKKYNDDETSLVYVIEDEELDQGPADKSDLKDSEHRQPRRSRPYQPPPPGDWRRKRMPFENEEEARIQRMLQEEQEQLEWESKLTRELEMEQWKEDRIRRDHRMRGGRGRARFPPPGRWESPPREPEKFDIARGKLFQRGKNSSRSHLRRPGEPPHIPHRSHPFPSDDNVRMRHPLDDRPRRPPSPGAVPPPGWDMRRPRSPPGLRMPPPPFHDHHEERIPEWERHPPHLPPRDVPFHHEDRRRSPFERRTANEAPPVPDINQVDVNKLLGDLMSWGVIVSNKKAETDSSAPAPPPQPTEAKAAAAPATEAATEPVNAQKSPVAEKEESTQRSVSPFIEEDLMTLDPDAEIPDVTLKSDLKVRHDEIIKRLYTGIQCSACGLRFTTRQTDLYADHLDWHYRLNRKDKEGSGLTHRQLYPTAGDWICFEEIENPEERGKNLFFEDTDNLESTSKADNDLTVPLTGKPGEDLCKVCKEAFETFYSENEDEWQFANCVHVDGDNFHPSCYGDYNDQVPQTPLLSPTSELPASETLVEEPREDDVGVVEEEVKVEPAVNAPPANEDAVTPMETQSEDNATSDIAVVTENNSLQPEDAVTVKVEENVPIEIIIPDSPESSAQVTDGADGVMDVEKTDQQDVPLPSEEVQIMSDEPPLEAVDTSANSPKPTDPVAGPTSPVAGPTSPERL